MHETANPDGPVPLTLPGSSSRTLSTAESTFQTLPLQPPYYHGRSQSLNHPSSDASLGRSTGHWIPSSNTLHLVARGPPCVESNIMDCFEGLVPLLGRLGTKARIGP
eukprot:scaffold128413_cov51-Attheya_sp.AAC.1